jgi:hypothetical protein
MRHGAAHHDIPRNSDSARLAGRYSDFGCGQAIKNRIEDVEIHEGGGTIFSE